MQESVHQKAKEKEKRHSQAKVKAKETRKEVKGKAKVKQIQKKEREKANQHHNMAVVGHAEEHISIETVRKGQHHQEQSEACPVFER